MAERTIRCSVHRGSYRDSVELMGIAAQLERGPGVLRAGLVMGTPANRAVLVEAGLHHEAADDAGPNDLIVALAATDAAAAEAALGLAGELLSDVGRTRTGDGGLARPHPATIGDAMVEQPDANLALISTPGTYATAEALKALKRGLNVFLFSDNVPLDDELELKTLAVRKGLLVMGPDCGTAIIGGVPLGFANAVHRGPVGLVAASGTGLQQVTCLIDRLGSGVSHAIGIGGRDLTERIGGRMMLAGLDRLARDPATRVIVLISKPPSAGVAGRILGALRGAGKPVVVNFLGGDPELVRAAGGLPAATFEAAALAAVALASDRSPGEIVLSGAGPDLEAAAGIEAAGLAPGQTVVRGLYSGGSLAGEARLILAEILDGGATSRVVDLGDDEYTVGRPHPMIDPRLRNEFIVATAGEPDVACLLLDVVLGFGAHPDPAGAMTPAIGQARQIARAAGRELRVVASVCGTDGDPQGLADQERILTKAGVLLAPSNARAARLAALIARAARAGAARRSAATVAGMEL